MGLDILRPEHGQKCGYKFVSTAIVHRVVGEVTHFIEGAAQWVVGVAQGIA